MISSVLRFVLLLLALFGFADCLLIAATILLNDGQCSGLGACSTVLHSSYSQLGGIPLWQMGAAFYAFYGCALTVGLLKRQRRILRLCQLGLVIGVLFSLWLIYLQAFKIDAWCPLCLVSAAIQIISLIVISILLKVETTNDDRLPWPALSGATLLSLIILGLTFKGAEQLQEKFSSSSFSHPSSTLISRFGEREVHLSDIPEYMTMRHEFDQFIWTKAKDWYRRELLNYAAAEKGHPDSTTFVEARYTEAGGLIDIGAEETRRRFEALKQEYRDQDLPLPSDEKLFEELQIRFQKKYDEFVNSLTAKMETELGTQYLLKPPSVDLKLDPTRMPVLGPADAPIKIVEISDYHCAFCRKMHAALEEVIAELGEDQVQLAYVNHYWDELPAEMTRETATLAMRAGWAAWQQDKFWEFTHLVFDQQDRANLDDLQTHLAIADGLALDRERFESDLLSEQAHAFIEQQRELQALAFADKPPTLLVNGFFVKANRESILKKVADLRLLEK